MPTAMSPTTPNSSPDPYSASQEAVVAQAQTGPVLPLPTAAPPSTTTGPSRKHGVDPAVLCDRQRTALGIQFKLQGTSSGFWLDPISNNLTRHRSLTEVSITLYEEPMEYP